MALELGKMLGILVYDNELITKAAETCGFSPDVFITAPEEIRIKTVMERMNLTREKAVDLIAKTDRKRETYYNYYTFGNWGVASNYDLCVDSSILGTEGTAEYIIDFARRSGRLQKEGK